MPLDPLQVLKTYRNFVVVGATTNLEKYGYKIFKSLKDAGYDVYPVNPNYQEIDGVDCVPTLKDLKTSPEVVVAVVPPQVTMQVIDTCKTMGVKVVWMPPGAWSEETVQKCEDLGLEEIHEACVMLAVKRLMVKEGNVIC